MAVTLKSKIGGKCSYSTFHVSRLKCMLQHGWPSGQYCRIEIAFRGPRLAMLEESTPQGPRTQQGRMRCNHLQATAVMLSG